MAKHIYLITFLLLSCIYIPLTGQMTTKNYTLSNEDFPNPERGFYRYSETRSTNYSVLSQSLLESYRALHQPRGTAAFEIYSTLIFRYFFLEDFVDAPISQAYLDNMQADFDIARAAGVKLIPRFAYTDRVDGSACGSFICPPYGDAPKARVLEHIEQVGPLLKKNRDVIAAIQMGWIGVWGEQYYTDYFGDASQGPNFKLTDQNWADRLDVLQAFLAATPTDRMIQVRYPQIKQKTIYGIQAPTSSLPLTAAEAYLEDDKSRLGFHNDCYLASDNDFGTYIDYGTTSMSSQSDTTQLKPYAAADSKYVVVGGETCAANNPDDNCYPAGRADSEMRRMHYSYLNADYNYPDVNADWEGDCIEDIKRDLGYRLHLTTAAVSSTAEPGGSIDITLQIENTGYAAPYNPRLVELILRNQITGQKLYASIDSDPRDWHAHATTTVSQSICLGEDLPLGSYEVLLNLADPQASLIDRADYAIRLASQSGNTDLWEPATGYHDLGIELLVQAASQSVSCAASSTFGYCHQNLYVSNVAVSEYVAAATIRTDAVMDTPSSFIAGFGICLEPDFSVPLGVMMEAKIDPCE